MNRTLKIAAILIGLPAITWWLAGAPTAMNVPELKGFNFIGGVSVSPEFTALLLGLVLYTAAFVAEVVRAGIQSVSRGQTEAAMSIGLKPGQVLNLVILPQALRVIIPPLTSQMLNLTKNSSLAVAIGYPDFVSVAGTTINQTGQAIEGVALIMAVCLQINLFFVGAELFTDFYNEGGHAASIRYLFLGLHGFDGLRPWIWSALALNAAALVILMIARRERVVLVDGGTGAITRLPAMN